MSTAPPAEATVREVVWSAHHEADGARYQVPVDERYALGADGRLDYRAYFYNMPIELNHQDGVVWDAGPRGRAILDVALRLVVAGARRLAEDERAPPGAYAISVDDLPSGSATFAVEPTSARWRDLDAPFAALIDEMQRATGRPKKPTELPQNPR